MPDESRTRRQRATVRQIAELSGVSIATVSRVLNGRADVAEETRRLVRDVALAHGYGLRTPGRETAGAPALVGITLPFTQPTYFAAILSGAVDALQQRGMRAVVCPTRHEHSRESSLLEALSHGETFGSILICPEETQGELQVLVDRGFQIVVIDPRHELGGAIPVVSAANASGSTQATEHLLALGHRRIGVITGPAHGAATRHRLLGHRAALAGAGLMPDAQLEVSGDFRLGSGAAGARHLLSLPEPPTAIFAFNDAMAAGAMQALREMGVAVPGDISVVGFDDTLEAVLAFPTLTTVRQPLPDLGRMAVGLLGRVAGGARGEPLQVELATRLVVRESTGPIPRRGRRR